MGKKKLIEEKIDIYIDPLHLSRKYMIDHEVYGNDASKKFYIEIKPFKPNLMEESLCEKVAFSKGVPVYLMPYVHQARE